jgi:Predicted kinase related to dihydroxyacetone kinase
MVDIAKGTTYDQKFDYDTFYNHLAGLGDSLLVINDDDVVKVHVHTEDPGDVINWGTHFGSLRKVKVDNMRDQQAEAASVAADKRLMRLMKKMKLVQIWRSLQLLRVKAYRKFLLQQAQR